ncbi:DNA recombination protein RmuC [Patescibacteria group bacterium]|nr:DNA recombination protein RmuC [Patescibacteria group bacterium]
MELFLVLLLIILIGLVGFVAYVIVNQKPQAGGEGLHLMSERIAELQRAVGESTNRVQDTVQRQLSDTLRVVRDVTEGLTKLDETNRQVVSFADQLQNLQDILKNPKQRGILGEYYLETVLQNVMPPGSFEMQYGFPNGEIVDAVVFVKDKIIPIDSKFSLENYNRILESREPTERAQLEQAFKRDLKNRIDETSKYVRPAEGTVDFAFMFIPSEGIYYDLLINQVGTVKTNTRDLIEYAFSKKVIIVSPTSFLAYLQTVLQGLKSLQIEEKIQDVVKNVGELSKHLGAYREYQTKLGNALGTVVNHFNATEKEFKKIDKDVLKIAGASMGVETALVDAPTRE